jgi:hypothetical protein
MMLQLNPPLPLQTSKGKAWAIALIDYGPQWDLQWITFLHESGECWTFQNRDIRQEENYTFGLPHPSPLHRPAINGRATKNGASIPHDYKSNGKYSPTELNENYA